MIVPPYAPVSLLIATRNLHKAREIAQVLGGDSLYLTLRDFPAVPDIVEDAPTFEGNAAKKASFLAGWLANHPSSLSKLLSLPASTSEAGICVLADDSGLEVDALQGAPGVHSARFAALDRGGEGNSSDPENNAKLLRLLENIPPAQRTARFRCVLAAQRLLLSSTQGNLSIASASDIFYFTGVCAGRISAAPSGAGGFGYDPLFIPDSHTQSFAELGDAVKNTLSHRAQALAKLRQFWRCV